MSIGTPYRCRMPSSDPSARASIERRVPYDVEEEAQEARGLLRRLSDKLRAFRARVHRLPGGRTVWRVGVALIGLLVILVGIVLLPLPGPGWLIIFLGLGMWATEFTWARQLLRFTRRMVWEWTAWVRRQPRWEQLAVGAAFLAFAAAVIVGSWYLVGML